MTHFKGLSSLSTIADPFIFRSMHAFMAFCIYEYREYADSKMVSHIS
ncbi:MAG: hypothetical protein RQ754_08195 [Desulfuromonadales bacterium]|nr:hypothetical protein [Desulfuromonadales bacterium]